MARVNLCTNSCESASKNVTTCCVRSNRIRKSDDILRKLRIQDELFDFISSTYSFLHPDEDSKFHIKYWTLSNLLIT